MRLTRNEVMCITSCMLSFCLNQKNINKNYFTANSYLLYFTDCIYSDDIKESPLKLKITLDFKNIPINFEHLKQCQKRKKKLVMKLCIRKDLENFLK